MAETDIGKKLQTYFENIKKIETLEYRKQQLIQENKKLEEKSKGVEIDFIVNIPSIDYSKERLGGGKFQSDYENQIDGFYKRIDDDIHKNNNLIINIEIQLIDIAEKTRDIEIALNFLEEEFIKILEMKYIKGYSQEKIGIEMNMSRGNVQYRLKKAHKELQKYLEYVGW